MPFKKTFLGLNLLFFVTNPKHLENKVCQTCYVFAIQNATWADEELDKKHRTFK